ncbi:MAG: ABC transporter ATP-binding protein [Anaerolineae bacterium]|nr:ABC transporter ATP-binding protein [Anaerolineae bacterium]
MTSLMELKNVSKIFASHGLFQPKSVTVALDDMSLVLEEDFPYIITVAGESGSGKTTLGMLLLGFYTPTMGEVLYNGQNIHELPRGGMFEFRRDVQAVFQDPFAVYNPFYKVDNLLSIPIKNFGLASSKAQAQNMMEQALSNVGLRPEETLGRYPHQLSGGQRQRIAVARALLLKPKLLIADEPVSMVDASLRATLLKALRSLNRDFGIPILYITHDLTTAYHVSDYIVILYHGSVMEAGNVDAIITDPKHPYTQLLVGSIPWPDPNRVWGDVQILSKVKGLREETTGCKFAPRCPHAFDKCETARPPLYIIDGIRAASCYLYESDDIITRENLNTLFPRKEAASRRETVSQ